MAPGTADRCCERPIDALVGMLLFDILLSFVALVILSPLLIIISLILKLTGEHEIFYRQARIGKNGSLTTRMLSQKTTGFCWGTSIGR